MKKLFGFEFHKLFSRVSLYILMAVCVILVLLNVAMPNMLNGMFDTMGENAEEMLEVFGLSVNSTADVFIVKAIDSGNMQLLLAILIAMIITQDYSENTIKNILSRGFRRESVYVTKLIICCAVAVVMGIIGMIVSWIAGTAMYSPSARGLGELLPLLLTQLLVLVTISAFYVLIAVFTHRIGAALAIGIVSTQMIPLLTQGIDLAFDYFHIRFHLTDYNVFNFPAALAKTPALTGNADAPLTPMLQMFSTSVSNETIITCAVCSVVWLCLFIVLGWFSAKKQEI